MGRPPGSTRGSWERFRLMVLAQHGDMCWICGHGGARTVDHVIPVTERPDLSYAPGNCRPAHGTRNKCATCNQFCNQLKGGYSLERARKLIAQRSPAAPRPQPAPSPESSGRDW